MSDDEIEPDQIEDDVDFLDEETDEIKKDDESDESDHENDTDTDDMTFELNALLLKDKKVEPKSIEKIIVPENDRCCRKIISDFELSKVLSIRSTQISNTGISFSEIKTTDPIELAKDEIKHKKCPLKILRRIDINETIPRYEIWSVNELEIINLDMGF